MLHNRTVAVVVPAYNEETQIGHVIETMPDFVDRIVIVNDKSKDRTSDVVMDYIRRSAPSGAAIPVCESKVPDDSPYERATRVYLEKLKAEDVFYTPVKIVNEHPDTDRIILMEHLKNGGVGAAIATGYKWCRDHAITCTAVMAGDGQMDPAELESLCLPVIDEDIDYVKGNRLIHPAARIMIPKVRFFGNSILSILTKIASGYWHVSDTQTGYTAISLNALRRIRLYKIYHTYGMPNDMLVKLNINSCTLREIMIKPVYAVGEKSKMKIRKVVFKGSFLLLRCFFERLYRKYLFRSFHPLFLMYHFAFIMLICAIPYACRTLYSLLAGTDIGVLPVIAFVFCFFGGFQSLLFAMWFDMQDNERFNK